MAGLKCIVHPASARKYVQRFPYRRLVFPMSEKTTRDSILIIDDDSDLRAMIDAMAGIYGVRVLQAADCSTGIRILQREHRRIKLIFLDYFLPGMTPGQCATALLAKPGP